jgi:outer membrane protein OmpA-like peptidoglycan-associated protein
MARSATVTSELQDIRKELASLTASVVTRADATAVETELQALRRELASLTASVGTRAGATAVETELQALRKEIAALKPKPDPRANLERWMQTHAIFFSDGATYHAPAEADTALDALAALMRQTDTVIRIVGYTDERGSTDRNLPLALARAERVTADLTRRGIDPDRIRVIGRTAAFDISQRSGPSSPNRRVAFEPAFIGESQ